MSAGCVCAHTCLPVMPGLTRQGIQGSGASATGLLFTTQSHAVDMLA